MRKILFLCLFVLSLSAQIVDGISVIVEDKIITLYDIKQEMQLAHLSKKEAIDVLIRKKLEEIEIKKRGITVTQDEVFAEIRRLAEANHMSLNQFYDLVREKNALTSQELQQKIKERLLSQKLYQSIAMAKLSEPSQTEIEEYYKLHKEEFSKPSFIDVTIYSANNQALLEQKRQNPMFYSPQIMQQEQRIDTARVNPQLVALLMQTKEGHFTQVVPNGQGGFLLFYVQKMGPSQEGSFENFIPQIKNAIMTQKRAEILDDYFAKLKDSADIKIIRE